MTTPPRKRGPAGVLSLLHLDSIRNKILVLALLATLVPAVGTVTLSYVQNRRALTENLSGELLSRGSQAAREVDLWIDLRTYDVRVFTGSFEVSENIERIPLGGAGGAAAQSRLTEYLTGVHSRFTDYAELLVTDADVQPVAWTSDDPPSGVALDPGRLARLRRGETVLDEAYWDQDESQVSALLAVPIEEGAGARFLGVLAATLTFDAVGRALETLAPGEAGRVDLITGDGRLIASSSGDGNARRLSQILGVDVLAQLRATDGSPAEYVDREGTAVVGTLTAVPGLSWAVVAQIPSAEAFAQVTQLRNSAILLVSFLLVVVGGIAYLLGLVIVRPLAQLTEGAGAVAVGDLSVDLPTEGRGEVGYLTEVFNQMVRGLRESREELDQRNRQLELLSTTDLLTGLYNRRYMLDALNKEIQRADRLERSFCVLMIDIDHFKRYNDTHGHLAGDEALSRVGTLIQEATREIDVCARYGGEEFIVLLPECGLENGIVAAERIRSRLARETFEGGTVTMSVGIAEFPAHGDGHAEVIAAADAALYEAKRQGRDQVRGAGATTKTEAETQG